MGGKMKQDIFRLFTHTLMKTTAFLIGYTCNQPKVSLPNLRSKF